MTFSGWIIRQANPLVRCPLLLVWFPLDWGRQLIEMVTDGHGARLFEFEYWDNTWEIFWAAMEGRFVGL